MAGYMRNISGTNERDPVFKKVLAAPQTTASR
jgi:hypothetical protein